MMLRTGAPFSSKFGGRSARECNLERTNDEILRMLRTGARFFQNFQNAPHKSAIFSDFSECCARERELFRKFQDAPHRSAIFNDEVDEGSTKAILNHYRGTPRETPMLNEEDDLERSTPVVNLYSFRRPRHSVLNDEVDEGYTDRLPGYSAQDHFERRKPPGAEYAGTQPV